MHLSARKRFGQHFLIDGMILRHMKQAIAPKEDDRLVEIGPGLGALTRYLVGSVAHYDAIEIDRDFIPKLQQEFGHHHSFKLHAQDVLQVNWQQLANHHRIRVVGNLPYNISTPLLFHLFEALDVIDDMHFLLQKEVANRLAAPVGASHYGRLSVMAQYHCDVELLFEVEPRAFDPPPQVDSTFLRLIPRPQHERPSVDMKVLTEVVAAAFNQRRKTLRNSLQQRVSASFLDALNIDPQKRAQNVTVDEYVKIANALVRDIL